MIWWLLLWMHPIVSTDPETPTIVTVTQMKRSGADFSPTS